MEACRPKTKKAGRSSSRGRHHTDKQDVHGKSTRKKARNDAATDAEVKLKSKSENEDNHGDSGEVGLMEKHLLPEDDSTNTSHQLTSCTPGHFELEVSFRDTDLRVQNKQSFLQERNSGCAFHDPEQKESVAPCTEHLSQSFPAQVPSEVTVSIKSETASECQAPDNLTIKDDQVKNGAIESLNPPKANAAVTEKPSHISSSEDKENEIAGPPCGVKIKRKFLRSDDVTVNLKALLQSQSINTGMIIEPSDVKKEPEVVEDLTFKSVLDDPYESLSSRTARLTELGDLRFDENRDTEPQAIGRRSIPLIYNTSRNVFHAVTNFSFGRLTRINERVVHSAVAANIGRFEVVDGDHQFNTRFTTLEWHPRRRNLIVACSNGGDVGVYSAGKEHYSTLEKVESFPGIGHGGCITDMKFHPTEDNLFFTSSKCGKVSLKDITGKSNQILIETCDYEKWYTAVEAHKTDRLVLGGQRDGSVNLITRDGEKVWKKQLHMRDITSIEFLPRESTMFSTASLDGTVRFWDIRKVEDKKPVDILFHMKGVSSACFSLTDGNRLLTTDVYDEIRVYKGPHWRLETCIKHPHKWLWHHTPIEANWHPFRDIIMCGRHPDLEHPDYEMFRCVDMFDAASGVKIGETKDTLYDGVPCLNRVNMDGDKLAIAMGYNITLWNTEPTFDLRELSQGQLENFRKSRKKVCDNVRMRGRDNSMDRKKKRNKKLDKLQSETETETENSVDEAASVQQLTDHVEEGPWVERHPRNTLEFRTEFYQHIGGSRLLIRRRRPNTSAEESGAQPSEGAATPAGTSGASRPREGSVMGRPAGVLGPGFDQMAHRPASQAGARSGEEVQMEMRPMPSRGRAGRDNSNGLEREERRQPSREEAASPQRGSLGFFSRLMNWMSRK